MNVSGATRPALAVALLIMFVLAMQPQAQAAEGVPQLISYQGRLLDSAGDPVADGDYQVTFTIWSDSVSTSPTDRVWISPGCTVTVVGGFFNWLLGTNEGLSPWMVANNTDLWLGVQVASGPELAPRARLSSAPYAYKAWRADYAGYADSAGSLSGGGVSTGWVDDGWAVRLENPADYVGIGVSGPTQRLEVDGTIKSTGFMMPNGHANGYVMTSDASGEGHWLPAPSSSGPWTSSGSRVVLLSSGDSVGIGTSTPGEKLTVVGNARIEGKVTWQAKTSYVSISAAAFVAATDGILYDNSGQSLAYNSIHGDGWFYAQVQLPQNGVITSIACYWADVNSTDDGEFYLRRFEFLGNKLETMAEAGTTGSSGRGTSGDASIDYGDIDNSAYTYHLAARLYPQTELEGVIIEYQISEVY